MEAIHRLYIARTLCLAPHVCMAFYRAEPLPFGWNSRER